MMLGLYVGLSGRSLQVKKQLIFHTIAYIVDESSMYWMKAKMVDKGLCSG